MKDMESADEIPQDIESVRSSGSSYNMFGTSPFNRLRTKNSSATHQMEVSTFNPLFNNVSRRLSVSSGMNMFNIENNEMEDEEKSMTIYSSGPCTVLTFLITLFLAVNLAIVGPSTCEISPFSYVPYYEKVKVSFLIRLPSYTSRANVYLANNRTAVKPDMLVSDCNINTKVCSRVQSVFESKGTSGMLLSNVGDNCVSGFTKDSPIFTFTESTDDLSKVKVSMNKPYSIRDSECESTVEEDMFSALIKRPMSITDIEIQCHTVEKHACSIAELTRLRSDLSVYNGTIDELAKFSLVLENSIREMANNFDGQLNDAYNAYSKLYADYDNFIQDIERFADKPFLSGLKTMFNDYPTIPTRPEFHVTGPPLAIDIPTKKIMENHYVDIPACMNSEPITTSTCDIIPEFPDDAEEVIKEMASFLTVYKSVSAVISVLIITMVLIPWTSERVDFKLTVKNSIISIILRSKMAIALIIFIIMLNGGVVAAFTQLNDIARILVDTSWFGTDCLSGDSILKCISICQHHINEFLDRNREWCKLAMLNVYGNEKRLECARLLKPNMCAMMCATEKEPLNLYKLFAFLIPYNIFAYIALTVYQLILVYDPRVATWEYSVTVDRGNLESVRSSLTRTLKRKLILVWMIAGSGALKYLLDLPTHIMIAKSVTGLVIGMLITGMIISKEHVISSIQQNMMDNAAKES